MGTHPNALDRAFVTETLNEMVSTNSVNPDVGNGPGESALSDLLYDRLAAIGRLEVRRQRVADQRSNVVAILRGSGGGRSLMLNGHMDTVGVEGMTVEPFTPFVRGGFLHGRGACDMKGGIAAMLGAVKSLADSKLRLRGDLILSFVVDEEHMSIGVKKLVEEYKADAAIVGEPTNMRIATAHKGFVWVEITVRGRAAHGSVPEKGVDAIVYGAKVVTRIGELQEKLRVRVHPLVGTPKIHTSMIEGGTHWSIVPDRCSLRIERRTIPGETTASVMQEIQELLNTVKHENGNFNAEARCVLERPALETTPTESIVQELQQAITEFGDGDATVVGVPYWTDGAILVHSASIPTCLFGPGDISVAHSPDEYIRMEDVLRASEVYIGVARKFCA
jgi:acetylornithine deacetylase